MRKLIAGINMTLDGYCDHDSITPDAEVHQHYTDLLFQAGAILYGRITYQLMEYWKPMVEKPSGIKTMDEFAVAMNNIPKIVFSRTLKKIEWESARLATRELKDEVIELKKQDGKDIYVGSPGLIAALTNFGLIDEYQICIHPVILGNGLPLFKNIVEKKHLRLIKTKILGSGAPILYYTQIA